MKRHLKPVVAISFVMLMVSSALGHDYWLLPDAFFLPVGGTTSLHLYLGEGLISEEERPFQQKPTVRFELFSTHGTQALSALARDGEKPVAQLRVTEAGNYLVVMERSPQLIVLPGEKFTEYLRAEGLDAISAERARRGETGSFGHERYNRYLKSLIQVGTRHDDSYARVVGQRLEIVPLVNPYRVKSGHALRVRILFEGRPLGGAQVVAYHRQGGTINRQAQRTTADGVAAFKLAGAGEWLLRLVHMRRCTAACGDTEWESFWGAYSFGLK